MVCEDKIKKNIRKHIFTGFSMRDLLHACFMQEMVGRKGDGGLDAEVEGDGQKVICEEH